MFSADNVHEVKDVFGVPLRVGDRVLKSRVSKFGGHRGWYLVRGFGETSDGYPTVLMNKINGFNRSHVRDKVKQQAVKQANHRSYRNQIKSYKKLADDNSKISISRRIGVHTSHYGYYIDHKWRQSHVNIVND